MIPRSTQYICVVGVLNSFYVLMMNCWGRGKNYSGTWSVKIQMLLKMLKFFLQKLWRNLENSTQASFKSLLISISRPLKQRVCGISMAYQTSSTCLYRRHFDEPQKFLDTRQFSKLTLFFPYWRSKWPFSRTFHIIHKKSRTEKLVRKIDSFLWKNWD